MDGVDVESDKNKETRRKKIREYHKKWRDKNADRLRKKDREYFLKNKEKIMEYKSKWVEDNRDRVNELERIRRQKRLEQKRKYYEEHKEEIRLKKKQLSEERKAKQKISKFRHHLKKYNISYEDYMNILEKQQGKCLGCYRTESQINKRLSVDHCHKTGRVRGLICFTCNLVIGNCYENIDTLNNLIEYLKKQNEYN